LAHLRPQRRIQQGLRYVNHIDRDLPASKWRTLINPKLLGAIGGSEFGDEVEQAMSDLRFRRRDGTLVLRHGLVRAGPSAAPGYLLDFDYFTQQSTDVTVDTILQTFDGFHDVIYPFFRWCLNDGSYTLFRSSTEVKV